MLKSIVKFTIVFVLTAALAIGAASGAFWVTRRIIETNEGQQPMDAEKLTNTVDAAENDLLESTKAISPDYYTIRLEGETINVYAAFGEREDFLYNAEVYKSNLSHEDIQLLSSGVKLESHADLTSFIEDYTS